MRTFLPLKRLFVKYQYFFFIQLEDVHKKLENSTEAYEGRLRDLEDRVLYDGHLYAATHILPSKQLKENSLLNKTESVFEELSQQVAQLKVCQNNGRVEAAIKHYSPQHDLWQRESSEKRRKMLQQIKILEKYIYMCFVETSSQSCSYFHTVILLSSVSNILVAFARLTDFTHKLVNLGKSLAKPSKIKNRQLIKIQLHAHAHVSMLSFIRHCPVQKQLVTS